VIGSTQASLPFRLVQTDLELLRAVAATAKFLKKLLSSVILVLVYIRVKLVLLYSFSRYIPRRRKIL
jgi:hypothetical protein